MEEQYNIENLEQFLTGFDLTPKQAKIYVTGLTLGGVSIQKIADAAGLGRTNSYDAVKALVAKGLMATSTSGKKQLYVSQPPKVLVRLLEEKKELLAKMLPQLESLPVASGRPKILFFPGLAGYKTAYEDSHTAKEKKLFGIYSPKDVWDVLGEQYADYMISQRVKRGISLQVIRSRTKEVTPGKYPNSSIDMREVRFAPEGFDFPISTYVYDNKVLILSSRKELFGLIIESADIAAAHRNYFAALWQISTPYEKLSEPIKGRESI